MLLVLFNQLHTLKLTSTLIFRQTIRDLVNITSPGKNEAMRKNRLKRRVYKDQGPNHIWHVDGNDKIKLFGFCISGTIDGWSHYCWRRISQTATLELSVSTI